MLSSWVRKEEILALGQGWGFDAAHAALVNRLALRFFDLLQPIHHMGATERLWLSTAAWLHDIAKNKCPKDHHKRAQNIILQDNTLHLHDEARHIVALLARFHRGESPLISEHIRHLDRDTRHYLVKLAALLRLADGLDRGGRGFVEDILCRYDETYVYLDIIATRSISLAKFHRKAELFTQVFGRSFLPQIIDGVNEPNFLLDSDPTGPYAESL